MNAHQFWFWIGLLAAGLWVPLPLLLSILIVYSPGMSKKWLVPLAAISELFTTLPPGILTGTVVLPWLVHHSFAKAEAKTSVWFFLLLMGTVTLQYLLLGSADFIQGMLREGFGALIRFIPWWPMLRGVVATALTAFGLLFIRGMVSPLSAHYEGRHSF